MTVPSASARNTYTGNGVASAFSYTFKITDQTHLLVTKQDTAGVSTTLVLTTDYTVAGVNNDNGGTVTLVAGALASGYALSIRRVVTLTQTTDLRNQGTFFPETHETEFDYLTWIDQQQQDLIARSLVTPESESSIGKLPAKAVRANLTLGFDSNGDPVAGTAAGAAVSSTMAAVVASASLGGARTALGGVPKVVATIAALKALATTDLVGDVLVEGYAAAGDGGGAIFRWSSSDSSTDNGGTVIAPNAGGVGRWNRVSVYQTVYNLRSFGAVGDGSTDDSAKIQAALDAANAAGGGTVFIPLATFVATGLIVYSNTRIIGEGAGSTLKHKLSASQNVYLLSVNPGTSGTTSVSGNQTRISISDIRLLGTSSIDGFLEHQYLLNLNAVSDIAIERVVFQDFRGDGIYLGSSNNAGTERHNERVTVRKCIFDGVAKASRNGISVIDCNGLLIDDCYFTRCSKASMPGAIDIEPDGNAFSVIRNITIRNCKFYDVAGGAGTINMLLPYSQAGLTTAAQNIIIEGNYIDACSTGISLTCSTPPIEADVPHDVKIRDNFIRASGDGTKFFNLKGVQFTGNHTENIFSNCDWGFTTAGWVNLDVLATDNRFHKCAYGGSAGIVIAVHAIKRFTFTRNTFTDCGKSDGSIGIILDFNDGTSDYVTVRSNRVECPTAPVRTTVFIQKEAAHTFTGAHNRESDNDLSGLSIADGFVHTSSGEVLTATVVWNAPSVANGAKTSTTMTVTGAVVGDYVSPAVNVDLLGLSLTGYVSAADTVTLLLCNNTGGAVDLANATYAVRVTKV